MCTRVQRYTYAMMLKEKKKKNGITSEYEYLNDALIESNSWSYLLHFWWRIPCLDMLTVAYCIVYPFMVHTVHGSKWHVIDSGDNYTRQ